MGSDSSGLGDFEGTNYIVYSERKANGVITKGDVLTLDSAGKWIEAPTSGALGPYGVATKSKLAGDLDVPVCTDGIIIVRSDGAIKTGKYVMVSASTAGEVIEYTAATIATTPGNSDVVAARDDWKKVVGRYIGHPGEVGPGTDDRSTDAADGDLIIVQIGAR